MRTRPPVLYMAVEQIKRRERGKMVPAWVPVLIGINRRPVVETSQAGLRERMRECGYDGRRFRVRRYRIVGGW